MSNDVFQLRCDFRGCGARDSFPFVGGYIDEDVRRMGWWIYIGESGDIFFCPDHNPDAGRASTVEVDPKP